MVQKPFFNSEVADYTYGSFYWRQDWVRLWRYISMFIFNEELEQIVIESFS